MDDMLKDFVVEAMDLAVNVEEHLLRLERDPDNKETLNAVFRSFHTIKGGAGFMGLPALVAACHLTENLFDALRTGAAPVTPLAIEAALQASGFVADQLTELANGAAPESLPAMPQELEHILTNAIEGKDAPAAPTAAPVVIEVVAETVAAAPLAATPVVGEDGLDWTGMYNAVVPEGSKLAASPVATVAATPAAAPVATAAPATATAAAKPAAKNWDGVDRREGADVRHAAPVKEDSIRVDAVKLDALLEVAGESVQAANQAAVLLERLLQFKFEGPAASLMATLAETLERASRYSTELQRATLATRMQPVGRLFQKFPRLVRELAKDLGKDVELTIEGAETEVDRVVVDSLYDPLVHMLRNSLDHGVESPEDRLAAGKPAKSYISLKAWQEANSVMIVLQDDGKGMDPVFLRSKAQQKGLISENAQLSNDECFQLVFLPGFSTKEVASSVSGRGVGMDVVKTAVEKNRGAIHIESALGHGTKFAIRLPIELSIVPTMLVSTSGAALALPMAVVQRVVELPETFMEVGGAPVLKDQGRPLPVRSLAGALGYESCSERVGIVVAAPQPYILAVEAVDGTADLVIKPMTAITVEGITGTARSAEGELVLVVGLSFLMDGCRGTVRLAA
ncbi:MULTISPECIES: chemotaxis protein CheA [unclassified Janthinobacterium]|uniref:chemotaxis protein CheA n=1 Tax=unclassified Janthinobacterium TaxID=2610881 RepID=UPI00161D5976|nr:MULTISPECIES: chemotaxis protein CheA [unclassified Janthinobacterium]MBB5367296.1 two-component system chemotaxis sensor kinase CheA [Janthinobacterium sp. K2C7]MBB5380226.1 two-component system chemotaxis sensor kinase CheA [Janthinobacterium sp. K2Li3]MBB5385678.1 two-component system chemotaxis sensor kinase CheA [Janthinobacterium sp. K2E3]